MLGRAVKAAEIIAKVYRRFKFDLNYSPGKSEAFVAFRGKGAKHCRISLAVAGSTLVLHDGKNLVKMRVVHRYVHLGTASLVTGSIDAEICNRVHAAAGALANLRQIFKMGLSMRTNVLCIKLYVFLRLFYGAGAWLGLSEKNQSKIRKIYLQAFRFALRQNFDGEQSLMTNEELLLKYDIDPVENLLTSMRLKFYSMLVVHASESLRTVLSATVDVEGPFAHQFFSDVSRVRKFCKLASMPDFRLDPHRWSYFCTCYGAEFRSILELWLASCRKFAGPFVVELVSLVPLLLPAVVRSDLFVPHICAECS